jgi:ion channel
LIGDRNGRRSGRGTTFLKAAGLGLWGPLGYGDVIPLQRWRLIGPITAMNGVLLFGWSTAVIFEVLRRMMIRTFPARVR